MSYKFEGKLLSLNLVLSQGNSQCTLRFIIYLHILSLLALSTGIISSKLDTTQVYNGNTI